MLHNIDASLKGDILTLKIDVSKRLGVSSTKKSERVASTGGPVQIVEGVTLNVQCYTQVRPVLLPTSKPA